jgi:HlyD family secretion protein
VKTPDFDSVRTLSEQSTEATSHNGSNARLYDFAPVILKCSEQPPSPLPRSMLYLLLGLVTGTVVWATVGKLDIVAVASGKLVPQSFIKVVQPADSGIIKEILVKEGDGVEAGQVLMRMDAKLAEADRSVLGHEIALKALQLRRIDAELQRRPLQRAGDDPPQLYAQIEAQYRARRQAYRDALDGEKAMLAKAQQDLQGAIEIEGKLNKTVPIYRAQAEAWDQLAKEGFAGKLLALDRQRLHVESEQDLRAQAYTVASLRASITQGEKRIAQITSNYYQQLQNERVETAAVLHKLKQDWEKQQHKDSLLELVAPQRGIVKDLATHTIGTVVAPGTILLTLVPQNEPLQAEVWVSNLDVGFIQPGLPVKIKLAAYPFQKYGMLTGMVRQVGADATENKDISGARPHAASEPLQYRALVALVTEYLEHGTHRLHLSPGMQLNAEIHLGSRTVLEYLLSPLHKVVHEAGRER